MKVEYKAAIGDARDYLSKGTTGAADWKDLSPYKKKIDELVAEAEKHEVSEFGMAVMLHEKNILKKMWEPHLLATHCDEFAKAMTKPLQALQKHTTLVYNVKRVTSANNAAQVPAAKKARKVVTK